MGRCVLIVIDSFGIGAMDDVAYTRPRDIDANTALHLITNERLFLPNLQYLGIMNALGEETELMKKNPKASFAKSKLMHFGADTYQGHQEIVGTKPSQPRMQSFREGIDDTEKDLLLHGFSVERFRMNGNQALVVNKCMFIGDNMETDLGQVINVSGSFKYTDFATIKTVGHIVRAHFQVSRVIAFGGEDVELSQLLGACFTQGEFIGLDTPKTTVYDKGYLVQHIGYGVDSSKQVPHALHNVGIHSFLYGKAADIIINEFGTNFYGVDTATLFKKMKKDIEEISEDTFFFLNVQETDLAGHQCNPKEYAKVLKITDERIGAILGVLNESDLLIVMADHGNDPYSGHSFHTRENVPILIHKSGIIGENFGLRETMSDVGQTVAAFFGTRIENGNSLISFNNKHTMTKMEEKYEKK